MPGAFLYDDRVPAATLSAPAGTPVPSLPLSFLTDPQPRLRARLMGSTASILVDFGSDTAIEAAALISTNLPASATVRWRVGPAESLIEATPLFDIRFTDLVPVYPAGWTFNRASTAYSFDANGALVQAAADAPRLDYDPVSKLLRGLLLEEARANRIANPRGDGAVAGTPGTRPTGWPVIVVGSGLTSSIAAAGAAENGFTYSSVRVAGTTTSSTFTSIRFVSTTDANMATIQGDTWALSCFLKLIAGSWSGATSVQFEIRECDAGGAILANANTTITNPPTTPLGTCRASVAYTITQATTAFLQFGIRVNYGNGAVVDWTLAAVGQAEKGSSVPSSPILPPLGSPAATTRAADIARVTGLTIGSAFTLLVQGQATGAAGQTLVPGGVSNAVGFNDASYMTVDASGTGAGIALAGGVGYGPSGTVVAGVGAQTIMALAVDAIGVSFARNGTLRTSVTTVPVPTSLDRASIGGALWGTPGQAIGVGWYQRFALYLTRLLDTQVTALSSTGSSLVTAALVHDSGTIAASTDDGANGNVILLRSSAATGRYLQVDVTAPSASFIDLGRLIAGSLWRPAHAHAYGIGEGRLVLDRRDRNALTGAEFPVPAVANPRMAKFTLPLLTAAEIRGQHRSMLATLGAAGDALWIPDTGLSQTELNQRSLYGAIAGAGDETLATRDSPAASSRAFRITERL